MFGKLIVRSYQFSIFGNKNIYMLNIQGSKEHSNTDELKKLQNINKLMLNCILIL